MQAWSLILNSIKSKVGIFSIVKYQTMPDKCSKIIQNNTLTLVDFFKEGCNAGEKFVTNN